MQDQTSDRSKIVGLGHTRRMAKPWEDIAARLREARLALGYENQAEFARKARLSPKRYGNWESGDYRISLNGALALRDTYGLSLDFIYAGNLIALPSNVVSALRSRPRDKNSR